MAKEAMEKVTVIIPVCNTERYVGKCLDSLLSQSLREIQIICVNDGSTDGSGRILKEYARKDSRICVLEQVNQGQAVARNAALEISAGEYYCFVDSDDWLEKDALLNLYTKASEERLDVLYFAGETEYDSEKLTENHDEYFDRAYQRDRITGEVVSGKEMLRRQIEVQQYWRSACMCLIRSRFLKDAGIKFREGIRYEDNLFAYMLCLQAGRVASVPERYYHRLLRENSTITSDRAAADLYGYITSITDEISLLKEAAADYRDNEAFYAVIDETIKRAYTVWNNLSEEEKGQIDRYFRTRPSTIREGDLYYSLFLSWFREEEQRRQLVENGKQLRMELKKARMVQSELRQEKQAIYDSTSYRLGHMLLTPIRKISTILKKEPEITDSEKHLHGQMKTLSRRYENGVTAKKQQYHGPGNS